MAAIEPGSEHARRELLAARRRISELEGEVASLRELERRLAVVVRERERALGEWHAARLAFDEVEKQRNEAIDRADRAQALVDRIYASPAWRVIGPLRAARRTVTRQG